MSNAFDGLTQYAAAARDIWNMAQQQADANGAPVEIWGRDGWLVICEEPEPEGVEEIGWRSVALIEPRLHGPECACSDCGNARKEIAKGAAR